MSNMKRINTNTAGDELVSQLSENIYHPFAPNAQQVQLESVKKEQPRLLRGIEDEKQYVAQYVKIYNRDYQKSRDAASAAGRTRKSRAMEDVSTVDFSQSPYDASSKNAVYSNYNFTRHHEANKKLPIHENEMEITDKINMFDVVVIEGETGCGKSTQVPQYIMDNAARRNEYVNIAVTQPRKMAAIMLANRVTHERNWNKLCAYQIGLDNQTNPDTRLTYMTTEVLVQKMIHQKSFCEYTHIILDEVHERDSHTDFAMLIVKKLLFTAANKIKIILMSATIDADKFSRYFSIPMDGYTVPSPIISIKQLKKPMYKVFYYDTIEKANENNITYKEPPSNSNEVKPSMTPLAVECCILILQRFDILELADQNNNVEGVTFSDDRQGVLIFLPGLVQIESLINQLRGTAVSHRWDVFPLHSSITKAEQNKVLEPPRRGFRKIIVSTNIAESSLTIQDVSYVIDFCLTKTLSCDQETNYTSLRLEWASQASCTQRAGRVGRVRPGRVYRLVNDDFFKTLKLYGTPELCRTPLTESVLKVKMLDMGEPQALLALALDPPNLFEIHRTILVLKQVGALSVKKEGMANAIDGDLTFIGRVASSLPVDVRISKLIVFGYLLGCFKQTITIAAGLSLQNLFCRPFQFELPAHMGKITFAEESQSDCIAILNAYDLWVKAKAEGGFKWSEHKEKMWAQKQYLQLDVLRQMSKLIDELTRRLELSGLTHQSHLTIDNSFEQHLMLKMCIAAAFYPYYFTQSKRDNQDIDKYLIGLDPLSAGLITNLPVKQTSLYEGQLKELFRSCSHDLDFKFIGDGRAIMHLVRDAKAAVTCSERNANAVIMQLVLKMRQVPRVRDNLTVKLIRNATPIGQIKCRDERRIPAAMVPTARATCWKIFITHVEDADHFWAANVANTTNSEYNLSVTNLEAIIRQELSMCRSLNINSDLNKTYCLAPFTEGDSVHYYRARIESVRPANVMQDRTALVFFIDYGNSLDIPIKDLKTLPDELYEIPQLAIECKLSGIQPLNTTTVGLNYQSSWTQAAYQFSIQHLHYRMHECQIYSISNDIVRVILYVGNQLLNNILVEKKWARVVEESEESKFMNNLRKMAHRVGSNMQSLEERQFSHIPRDKDEQLQYDITLCEHTKIKFRGPFSPLEMTFRGLSPSLSSRIMNVEMNSVNSTALDLDSCNKHGKFIVAAFVSLSASESTLCTRNTTLMPGIPGLLHFCLMMFAPMVELRLNEDYTAYSGAIVGLCVEGEETYKSEDIEVPFDFEFKPDDILSLNVIRNCLNNSLDDLKDKNNYKMNTYQKKLQENIRNLVLQDRAYKKPESFLRHLEWNCIPPETIIVAAPEEAGQHPATFALINNIKLAKETNDETIRAKVKRLLDRHNDLRARKSIYREVIDEYCVVCNVALKSYGELSRHMMIRDHIKKEDRALGLI